MERGTSRRTAGDPMRHFSKLNDSVELPARATKGSAGYTRLHCKKKKGEEQ